MLNNYNFTFIHLADALIQRDSQRGTQAIQLKEPINKALNNKLVSKIVQNSSS